MSLINEFSMRAMILAAGKGSRMGKLTQNTPKALLRVKDRYLIEYSIGLLTQTAIKEVVINVCYHGDQIKQALGNGSRYGIKITYSEEEELLETGGGIVKALPMLGPNPFIVLSCDVITDYCLNNLMQLNSNLQIEETLAHLILVNNPDYHPKGDFILQNNNRLSNGESDPIQTTYTFGNIGIYSPKLFYNCKPDYFRLGDLLKQAITQEKVSGECYSGLWMNVGNPEDIVLAKKILMMQ